MMLCAIPFILQLGLDGVKTARLDLQLCRILLACLATTLGFAAFVHLPIAEVTIITFSKSFFVVLLAIVFLSEIVNAARWIAIIVGFVGVLIIVWPTGDGTLNIWHVSSIVSAACVAGVIILVRSMSAFDNTLTIFVYQAAGVGLLVLIPMVFFWQWPTSVEWIYMLAIGLVSALAQLFNVLSIRHAETTILAALEYMRLVFATILGFWIFAEWPDMRIWLGAAVIIVTTAFVMSRERIQK